MARDSTARNPWLDIRLADYEGHMALPHVGQARLLGDVFERMLREHRPRSAAVVGCAGGNGFERISTETTTRVVGVDVNPDYVTTLRDRFAARIPHLELIVGDVERDEIAFRAVDLVYAALVLEYVDVLVVLGRIRAWLTAGGVLGTVVQLPADDSPPVTPSPFTSLNSLASSMRLVAPDDLDRLATALGYARVGRRQEHAAGGKRFEVQTFRTRARGVSSAISGP